MNRAPAVLGRYFLSLALIGAAAFAASANANVVVDGNFDSPSGGTTFTTYTAGQTFGGWTVDSGSVDLIGGYWQAPPGGGGSVDLDGNSAGSISQFLNLTAGTEYMLKFVGGVNPDGGPLFKPFSVSFSGITYLPLESTPLATRDNMLYDAFQFNFIATGPTTLTFASLDKSDPAYYGVVIGNVSVTAVPEPATAALVVLGLGVMGFAARRRRHDSMSAVHA